MIEFDVLGPLQIVRDDMPVRLEATMLRRVLVVLLALGGRAASVEVLLDSLWSGVPPRTARKTVQIYVHRLRALLKHEVTITHGADGYRLEVSRDALDATKFEEMVRKARVARTAGKFVLARDMLQEALALWRGSAFAEFQDLTIAQPAIQRQPMRLISTRRLESSSRENLVYRPVGNYKTFTRRSSARTRALIGTPSIFVRSDRWPEASCNRT